MIKVTLEIDNKMAHSCSPIRFLQKFILHDMIEVDPVKKKTTFSNPYAKVVVEEIEQI
jgi:hypothetical protein